MATRVYHEWKDSIDSFDFNRRSMGISGPGRYAGFDTVSSPSGLNVNIAHGVSGVKFTNLDQSQTVRTAVWVSRQGSVITDEDTISLTLGSNAGNSFTRIDLLIGEHVYIDSIGTTLPVYSILQGVSGATLIPSLPNPEKQVVLGRFNIAPEATSWNSFSNSYRRWDSPFAGEDNDIINHYALTTKLATLYGINTFTNQQQFYISPTIGAITSGKWAMNQNGNVYIVPDGSGINQITKSENGTEVEVWCDPAGTAGISITLEYSGAIDVGKSKVYCRPWFKFQQTKLGVSNVMVINPGESVKMRMINDQWHITEFSKPLMSLLHTPQSKSYTLTSGDIVSVTPGTATSITGDLTMTRMGTMMIISATISFINSVNFTSLVLNIGPALATFGQGTIAGPVSSTFPIDMSGGDGQAVLTSIGQLTIQKQSGGTIPSTSTIHLHFIIPAYV